MSMKFRVTGVLALSISFIWSGYGQVPKMQHLKPEVRLATEQKSIAQLAFSPDGKLLANTGYGAIEIREAANWKLKRRLVASRAPVYALAFSPDGSTLASGWGNKGSVLIWDIVSGKSRLLKNHQGLVTAVSFLPGGKTLVTAGWDRTIKLWDVKSGRVIHTLGTHVLTINDIAVSSDGAILVSGSGNYYDSRAELKVWDLRKRHLLFMRKLSFDGGNTVAISPDGNWVAAGDRNEIFLLESHTGKLVRTFTDKNPVSTLRFSPSGSVLAAGIWTGDEPKNSVILWDCSTGMRKAEIGAERPNTTMQAIAFSPDGRMLVTGNWESIGLYYVDKLSGHSKPPKS